MDKTILTISGITSALALSTIGLGASFLVAMQNGVQSGTGALNENSTLKIVSSDMIIVNNKETNHTIIYNALKRNGDKNERPPLEFSHFIPSESTKQKQEERTAYYSDPEMLNTVFQTACAIAQESGQKKSIFDMDMINDMYKKSAQFTQQHCDR